MLSARRSWNACSIGKRRDPLTRIQSTLPMLLNTPGARRAQAVRVFVVLAALACLVLGVGATASAAAQHAGAANPPAAQAEHPGGQAAEPAAHGQPAAEAHGEAAAEGGEGGHAESPWALVARLFNFAILAGGLFYLLRSPLMGYLDQRGVTVRGDLTRAAELKREAGAQIAEIDARMKALPSEIDALKRRGAEEIRAEEARIRALAEAERRRLLEQAKREIDTQLRIAERDLKKRAGELAVSVATERVKRTITERDHARLVDRYVSQVRH